MNTPLIKSLYNKACREAFIQVKHEAKVHLSKNKDLGEFVMAMGTHFFVNVDSDIEYDKPSAKIDKLIEEFDSVLKITGNPIRIKKLEGKFNFTEVTD